MNCCVECEIDQPIAALEAPRSSESPDPYTGKGPALRGRQIRDARLPVACLSNVVRPESGIHGQHGTTPDLRTSSRGFTYSLTLMLGEGWYEEADG